MRFLAAICAVLLLYTNVQARPQVAGFIKTLQGQGHILRDATLMPAKIGDVVHVGDTVTTAAHSSLGIMLEDDTILSLGPESSLEMSDFAFAPQNEVFSMAVRLIKGSFAYMSGVIGRVAPEKVRVETPDAVIAIHGTRFLVTVEER